MRFRVLGPVDFIDGDRVVHIAPAKERTLLAVLLATPNRVLSTPQLIDELWDGAPPATAHKTLQTYVSHLRRELGDRIETASPGYRIRVAEGELDAAEFEGLVGDARLTLLRHEPSEGALRLGDALSLWRGVAFEAVDPGDRLRAAAIRLDDLRVSALEDWCEARLAVGEGDLVPELEVLAEANPYRERLWSLLMQALYRAGRQVDALRASQRARSRLADDLGIEPGPELRAVEHAVLNQELADSPAQRDAPSTYYATNSSGMQIAYSLVGGGRRTIVFVGDIYMNLELVWDLEQLAPLFDGLGRVGRLVAVHRRGTGSSDREADGSFADPLDCVGDIDAVLAAVGVDEPVALVGWGHGGQVAIAYAATRPERVTRLVLVNSYPRVSQAPDYADGYPANMLERWLADIEAGWGKTRSVAAIAGPLGDDPRFITRLSRLERLTGSPRSAVALHRALNDIDVRALVPRVACPTMVVFLSRSVSGAAGARWLAAHLGDGRLVELSGHFLPTKPEAERLTDVITAFVSAS